MKQLLFILISCLQLNSVALAQNSFDGFKYQAIIRDAAGNVNANASVQMEISILQGTADGTAVFTETHAVTSNAFGLVNLTIGSQNPTDFNLIDWANDPYFIKIVVDGIEFGTSQLLSVPYALHAKTATKATLAETVESIQETDPLFAASPIASITQSQIEEWSNKLSEFAETDPNFNASVAAGITTTQIESWTNKLDEYLETDPEFAASLAKGITASDTAYWNSKLNDFAEADPTFLAHPASGITAEDIIKWKALFIWYTTNERGYITHDLGNTNIKNLADPLNDQDAATKAYVDVLKQRLINLNKGLIESSDPVLNNAVYTLITAGGASIDDAKAITTDSFGNVYITGSFIDSINFSGIDLNSAGQEDIFIAKYDDLGNILWAKSAGGSGYVESRGISTDASGNVYITGYYEGTATFGSTSLASAGSRDVFIAKYDASGTCLWAKSVGGNGYDHGYGISTDANGNVYITGYYGGTATFGSTSLTSAGSRDVFIAKYNASGTCLWAKSAGGSSSDYGYSISIDAGGNVYITGYYYGTATFGTSTLTSAGGDDVFIAKYDASGTCLWAKSAGGSSSDEGRGISTDASGDVYITGNYSGTATFGTTSLTTAGYGDVFIAKYDALGTMQWAKSAGGSSDDSGFRISTDASGNVYITGNYAGTATFGTTSLTSAGYYDIFITKYNASGTMQWAKSAGGSSYDWSHGISTDAGGNVYTTGYYEGTATFGTTSLTSAGSRDVFIWKLNIGGF